MKKIIAVSAAIALFAVAPAFRLTPRRKEENLRRAQTQRPPLPSRSVRIPAR